MFKNKANKAQKASANQPVMKQDYLNNCHRTYSCVHCRAHLANHDELISKLFQGNHGRAYLFNKVVNIGCKQAVQRELLTGLHAVADIYCDSCETTLGWKYEQAFVPSQKYKEGKYIIELAHMVKENNWDLTSYNARELVEEEKNVGLSKRDDQIGFDNLYRSFEIGKDSRFRFPHVGSSSSNENYSNREDKNNHSEVAAMSAELGNEFEANGSKKRQKAGAKESVEVKLELVEAKKSKQIPAFDDTINSERNAGQLETRITTNDIELLELSLDKLHVQNRDNNNSFQTTTSNDNKSLSASPNNSLCSSESQSDLSHSSVMSATYSSTNEQANEDCQPSEFDNVRQQCTDQTLATDNNGINESGEAVADRFPEKNHETCSLVYKPSASTEPTLSTCAL